MWAAIWLFLGAAPMTPEETCFSRTDTESYCAWTRVPGRSSGECMCHGYAPGEKEMMCSALKSEAERSRKRMGETGKSTSFKMFPELHGELIGCW